MYTHVDPDQVSRFQITRILPEDEVDDTARIMVLDPLEHRIVIFEADTGLTMSAGADAVAERAKATVKDRGRIHRPQGRARRVGSRRESCIHVISQSRRARG